MSEKTDLRAACEAASHELSLDYYAVKVIERHIAPLLKSARISAIEECVKIVQRGVLRVKRVGRVSESYLSTETKDLLEAIRALKEQP